MNELLQTMTYPEFSDWMQYYKQLNEVDDENEVLTPDDVMKEFGL